MLFLYQGGQMTTYSYNDILEILFVNTFINQKVLKSKKEKSFYTYFDDYYNHLSIKHIDINEKERRFYLLYQLLINYPLLLII